MMTNILANETVILVAVFGSIILLAIAGISSMNTDAGARRIDAVKRRGRNSTNDADASMSLLYEDDQPLALRLIEPLQRRLAQSDPKQVTVARARLIEAGYYRPSAVETYFASRIVLAIGMAVAAVVYILVAPPHPSVNVRLFIIVAATAMGYYLPALFVTAQIDGRRRKFKMGMPDALDMMLVGVEAGLSLSASIKHIVKDLAQAHPIVSEQFQIVTLEFQAGRSRSEALESLARRMNIPITRTLASMIVQSETLGTSMAQTLQVLSDELRMQRMLDAEKRAAELPVKMSVPLVLCIFPALMAVALVPAMISTLNFFASMNN